MTTLLSPRLARVLRPAEWVLLAFLSYVAGYLWWSSNTAALERVGVLLDVRARGVPVALLIVSTVHLAFAWARFPKPVPVHLRRGLFAGLCLASLPVLFSALVELQNFQLRAFLDEKADGQFYLVFMLVLRVLGVGSPLLACWFATALYAKEHGQLGGLSMVAGFARTALSTLREWAPLLFFIPCYSWMEDVIGQPSFDRDATIQALDRALFLGADPLLVLQRFIWPPLSEWLAFSYSFFVLYFSISLSAIFMLGGRRALREGITALCLGMALTYVGYSLVPVAGPVMTMHFQVSLDLYYIKEVKEMLMDRSRIRYDCFPSFHTAGSLIMVWLCWRHARRVFWLTVPMAASTPLACVYLRYHYVTDVIAGVVLFVAVAYVVPRWLRRDDALTTPAVS